MLALLAPAKTLDFTPPPIEVEATRPCFEQDAAQIRRALLALSAARLGRLMKLSPTRAKATLAELKAFDPTAPGGLPAALAFSGEVYRGLRARELPTADLRWAQDRVGILSGLYGLLRPLDAVHPHRLEMATRVATPRGHNLYAHWGGRVTEQVNALVEGHADPTVVDLSSQEYVKVLWPRSLRGRLLSVVFENWKDAARTPHPVPTLSRRARGLMARFVVERRIERAEELRGFAEEGYAFQPDRSSAERYVFGRPFQER
ncbi:MAG: peroxide stress protein YaaA [Sandaracinaceae bacterium]|nr:peroxide stress protein YaaA [Sandaracinaceae bacterium]